ISLAWNRKDRCDEVFHQRRHDRPERRADHHRDRQVDDVASQDEGLEVFDSVLHAATSRGRIATTGASWPTLGGPGRNTAKHQGRNRPGWRLEDRKSTRLN